MGETTNSKDTVTQSAPTKDATHSTKAQDVASYAANNAPELKFLSAKITSYGGNASQEAMSYAESLLASANELKSPLLLEAAKNAAEGKLTPLATALARYNYNPAKGSGIV